MDYKELISSGKLELYALDALSPEEHAEIAQLLTEHEDLREEYDQIAEALTVYGKSMSEAPSINILEKANKEIDALENGNSEEEVITMPAKQRANPFRWMTIAASLLLLVSVAVNFKLGSELKEVQQDYVALQNENQQMAANTVNLKEETSELQNLIAEISSGKVVKTTMLNTADYEGYESAVFWDRESSKVILASNKLPKLDESKQYQLWAIIDGKPVDAGVFDSSIELQEMKSISGEAIAFAVTIEPKGGSIAPSLEKLCVMGNVAS